MRYLFVTLCVLLCSDPLQAIEGTVTLPVITGHPERRAFDQHPGWVCAYTPGESEGVCARIDEHGRFTLPDADQPRTLIAMFDRIETPPVIVHDWPAKPANAELPIDVEYACMPPSYPDVWREQYMQRGHGFYQTFIPECTQLYGASLFDGPKITWWGNKVRARIHEDGPYGPVILMQRQDGESLGDHICAGHSDFELPRMGWRHGDMAVEPHRKYAIRIGGYESHGGQHFELDAFVRPDDGTGYEPGQAYRDKIATCGDLCFLLFGNGNGQLVENHIRSEEWEIFIPKHKPTTRWGQTFVSHGRCLAGLSFWASDGRIEPSVCRVRIREGGPDGRVIGPTKTATSCDSPDRPIIRYPKYPGPLPGHEEYYKLPSDLYQVAYAPGEILLERGGLYYVEVDANVPIMMYADGDYYDGGHAWVDGERIIDKTDANKSMTFHSKRYTLAMNIVTYEHADGRPNHYPRKDRRTPEDDGRLLNGGAETGDFSFWRVGADPMIDPNTDTPAPTHHGGDHHFGISVGWQKADMYQYQQIPGVRAGQRYEAGFWAAKSDGTDETAELLWCDGTFGSPERLLARMPGGKVTDWTLYKGKPFTPTSDTITIVIRYKHPEPTNIASIHVDDIYLKCLDADE